MNKLPAEPGDKSNHAKAFVWGPTIGNDETKMKDFITAEWAVEQLKTREFDKLFGFVPFVETVRRHENWPWEDEVQKSSFTNYVCYLWARWGCYNMIFSWGPRGCR
ncbi:hypothetical protein OAH23_04560 [Verrucomicrobia bacterium]|nr:hypothetical protein [Verrucomicrobiota bacterium]